MGKKYKRLYEQICSEENLREAYRRASLGKKNSFGYLAFKEHAEKHLADIQETLENETWKPDPMRQFIVYEPKARKISAPTFRERVVHHALCIIIEPIFDAVFLPTSFACREGKGTHAGARWVQRNLRKYKYTHFAKTDFSAYFASINREVLHREIRRKISCPKTLRLITKIIPETGVGIPIGALTSQLSANIYGNIVDQYLHHQLKVPFARYMDDIIVLGYDLAELRAVKNKIENLAAERLGLRLSHWQVSPVSQGINFLGYRIWSTHKLLRKSSVTRAKRKIRVYTKYAETEKLRAFLGSWKGHIFWSNSYNLRRWITAHFDLTEALSPREIPTRPQLLENLVKGKT